ncbi:MAG: NmrA family NAD(P)-binding protein [Anaerolineales bacterium]
MSEHRFTLVTGAAGKTGLAVIRALTQRGVRIRALVRTADQAQVVRLAGASEILSGDLNEYDLVLKAMEGISAVYLLFPNMQPNEFELGQAAIAAAGKQNVRFILYHSVLFPQIEAMPHHWQKLRVEEALIQSGLAFTILQPASYMQNIKAQWEMIKSTGKFRFPYSINAGFSLVDLNDVAAAACECLLGSGHANAIYPLAGPQRLSSLQMAEGMGTVLEREVQARQQPLGEWRQQALAAGHSAYAIDALSKMFIYYDRCGFTGPSWILEWLIGRSPNTFSQYLGTLDK